MLYIFTPARQPNVTCGVIPLYAHAQPSKHTQTHNQVTIPRVWLLREGSGRPSSPSPKSVMPLLFAAAPPRSPFSQPILPPPPPPFQRHLRSTLESEQRQTQFFPAIPERSPFAQQNRQHPRMRARENIRPCALAKSLETSLPPYCTARVDTAVASLTRSGEPQRRPESNFTTRNYLTVNATFPLCPPLGRVITNTCAHRAGTAQTLVKRHRCRECLTRRPLYPHTRPLRAGGEGRKIYATTADLRSLNLFVFGRQLSSQHLLSPRQSVFTVLYLYVQSAHSKETKRCQKEIHTCACAKSAVPTSPPPRPPRHL